MMKIALPAFLLIMTVTTPAWARLGETPDQLVARYGQPLSEDDQKGAGDKVPQAKVVFNKNGFGIEVIITDGISVEETYRKLNGDPFSIGEVRTLLGDNSQGHDWEAPVVINGEKLWMRDDDAAAKLAQDGAFIIKSRELAQQEAMARKLEKHPSLEGF